ncbi:MAG TPA: tol-pal system protein YbgF [Xanthobacteraceae bacterium]
MNQSCLAAVLLSALAIAPAILSAQEAAPSSPGLFGRIFGGSERVAPPAGVAGEPSAQEPSPAPGANRLAQVSGSDLIVRIDRLEAQIRQLTGIVEQLQYRNQQIEAQMRRLPEDPSRTATATAPGPAPARQSVTPAPAPAPVGPPPAAAAPGRRGDAFDPSQAPNAPGVPRSLGTATAAAVPAGPPSLPPPPAEDTRVGTVPTAPAAGADEGGFGAPGGRPAGAPLDLSTLAIPREGAAVSGRDAPGADIAAPPRSQNPQLATLPPSNSPRDAYDLAYGYMLRRDYALAEEAFRTFLSKYPNERLAPEAQYWLGESLFQRQLYRDAAENFLNVSTKYETTAKAPDSLLRLGQSLAALGERDAACASFGEVLRKYPRAAIGVKNGVEREQRRAHC